ncbi:MAG TPA: DUF3135 domain-containing protein [Desulfobulbus sp.]|nr:DUF3135 domain-containing protein [Desulfobulbus sp.]
MPVQTTPQQSAEEHERLAALFREDRLAFERERRRLIKDTIARYDDKDLRDSLERQQQLLDRALRGSGSPENRLSLISALFWDQVINRFLPALDGTSRRIKAQAPTELSGPKPRLTLVDKPGK